MTLQQSVLLGNQVPTHLVVPQSAVSSAGAEAVELAALAGLVLDPWQELVLESALSERADGKWAALEVGLVVPRQNGKGSILEARELAGMFLLGEELILHSAHEFKTSQEAFRRVRYLIENCDDLDRMVKRVRTSNGEEAIECKNGSRLRFVARSSGSGRGFTGDCIIFDEAYKLSAAMMAALLPTLSARPNPQLWYTTSSPPEIDEFSEQIRRTKVRSTTDDPGRLCWVEWSSELSADPADPLVWAAANPALGRRIDPEFVEAERQTMPSEAFAVERLGVWKSQSLSAKIPLHAWEAVQVDESPGTEGVVFGVDLPPDRSSVSVAVCAPAGEYGFGVELADRRPGTDWLIPRCIELADRYPGSVFVIDGVGPSAGFITDLQNLGLSVRTTSAREYSEACTRLFDAVMAKSVTHTGQPELVAAVMGANTRKLGDSWAWSRTSSSVDISPLVAVTLALWGCATAREAPEPTLPQVFAY